MSERTAYLDRMSERLGQFTRSLDDISRRHGDDRHVSDLAASINVQRDRLNELRRAGAELTPEMVQSLSVALDALGTRIAREMQKAA